MQSRTPRLARLAAVAIGSIGAIGLGAGVADASTIRNGTPTTLPTSTSTVTPAGTTVGSNTLVGTASLSLPSSGSASCTQGALTGVLGTNPATSIVLNSPTLAISSCSDTVASFNLNRLAVTGVSSPITVQSTGSAGGTISIPNPSFVANITVSGTPATCNLVLATAGTVTGAHVNGTGTSGSTVPRIVLTNVRLRSTTAGFCASIFGSGSSSTNTTGVSHTFGPLRVGATAGGSFLGLFP